MRKYALIAIAVLASYTLVAPSAANAPPTFKPGGQFPIPANTATGWQVEMSKTFSDRSPFTGALVFTVNNEGIINGVYESDSIRPDPLYGHRVQVTGSISSGNHIALQLGVGVVAVTVRGSINQTKISASASNSNMGILNFYATRVHLKKPPQET